MEALRKKETQDETQFMIKIGGKEKLVWVPVTSFCKIFIHSYTFDALLHRNWPFQVPQLPDFKDNSIDFLILWQKYPLLPLEKDKLRVQ